MKLLNKFVGLYLSNYGKVLFLSDRKHHTVESYSIYGSAFKLWCVQNKLLIIVLFS